MSENTEPDWAIVYEVFDGTMAPCLGKNCTASCCTVKTVSTCWEEGRYTTSLEPGEYEFQIKTFGIFPDGVTIEKADIGTERTENIRRLICGCIADDGSCKMKGRKPANCRIFPFSTSATFPLQATICPNIQVIGGDDTVRANIIRLREALGFYDNDRWLAALDKALQKK